MYPTWFSVLKDKLKKGLVGCLLAGALSIARAGTPPTIDYKRGGTVTLAAPGFPVNTQLALIPGGPYQKSNVALQTPALSVVNAGHYAFVAAGGLQIFDLAPDAPKRLLAQINGQGKITQVVLRDGYAYLADSAGALLIVDVGDPQHPQQVASFPLKQP